MKFLPAIGALLLSLTGAAPAAEFVVTNTNNSGPGSLFQAITDANADPVQDTIAFNIPGAGVHVIDVSANPLPALTYPVLIDGYTQPGSHPNTLALGDDAVILIEVRGGGIFKGDGFVVNGGAVGISGLALTNFSDAIRLNSPAGGNLIQGNFIGVDPSGQTAAANNIGITVNTSDTTIGGRYPGARNIISGNGYGIRMTNRHALIAGNYIGTDASGRIAIPNSTGVWISVGGTSSDHAVVGGSESGSGNVISGNQWGIQLGETGAIFGHSYSNPAFYVTVAGNLIGTAADGRSPLGNQFYGVLIQDGTNNTIGGSDPASGNTIAYNARAISIQNFNSTAVANRILSNSIYGNGNRGIDIDPGANHSQAHPIVTNATIESGTATISGTLKSSPNAAFIVQLFADSLSFAGPGQTYLGSSTVTTDANGNATFSAMFPITDPNVMFNATATSAAGDTSDFFYNPARLMNVSTRLPVQAGDNALIAGFILARNGGQMVLRAIGPSMTVGGKPVAGALQDPTLELYDSTGRLVGKNDNWRDDPAGARSLGSLAPTNDLEAALAIFLSAGSYTVVMRGKNDSTGIGLVEAYFGPSGVSPRSLAELANLSTRGFVGTGDDVMIAGFIAGDSSGPTRFVVRAVGPSLTTAGVSNPLPDPMLELHDGNGGVIAANDDWKEAGESIVLGTGLAPKDEAESVILATLPVGQYTAIVRGKNNSTGVAVVEVYNLH